MHKIVFHLFINLLFLSFLGHAQSEKEIADIAGFDYHLIIKKDQFKEQDSIRFLITKSTNHQPKPTIIFVQGSGNIPLLITSPTFDEAYTWLPPFNIEKYKKKYRFVLISKPGIPLYTIDKGENPNSYDPTLPGFSTFIKNDYLDYYVNTTTEIIKYLKKEKIASKIFVIGHSSGAHVVAQLCEQKKPLLNKGVYLSADMFSRLYENIITLRKNQEVGIIEAEEAQEKIALLYKQFDTLKKSYDEYLQNKDTKNDIFYTYRNHYSYNYTPSYKSLLNAKVPVLVSYGTSDIKSIDLDLLYFLCKQEGQKNVDIKAYPGLDHNFFKKAKINDLSQEYLMDNVFEDVEKWLNK